MNDHDRFTLRELERLFPRVLRLGPAVTARDVYRNVRRFRNRDAGNGLLELMVAYGFGRWEHRPPGPRGGRPTRVFVPDERVDKTSDAAAAEPSARSSRG